jgi:hypothetical protein
MIGHRTQKKREVESEWERFKQYVKQEVHRERERERERESK